MPPESEEDNRIARMLREALVARDGGLNDFGRAVTKPRELASYLGQDLTPAQTAEFALGMAPVVGNAISAKDAAEGVRDRDWVKAGIGTLGALPLIGGMAKPFMVNYFGKSLKVLHNPSPKETEGFLNKTKYKAARRIVDPETGDTFIWDAADPALHHMMAEKVGIDPAKMTADMIGID